MMLQPLLLQLAKAFLGGDGESKQPGLNVPILAGNYIFNAVLEPKAQALNIEGHWRLVVSS